MAQLLAMVKRSVPQLEVALWLFASPEYVDAHRHVPSSLATKVVSVVQYVPLPLTFTVSV